MYLQYVFKKKRKFFFFISLTYCQMYNCSLLWRTKTQYVPFCLFSFHKVSPNVSCRNHMACQIYFFMSIIIYDNRQSYLKVNTVIINHKIWNVSEMRYLSYLCLDYTIDCLPDITNNFILIDQYRLKIRLNSGKGARTLRSFLEPGIFDTWT